MGITSSYSLVFRVSRDHFLIVVNETGIFINHIRLRSVFLVGDKGVEGASHLLFEYI